MKTAFMVIVEHPADDVPVIGDIHWALLDKQQHTGWGQHWEVHTTELTARMLAVHNLPSEEGV